MKRWVWIGMLIGIGAAVVGCEAMNSLIIHPLQVLHSQHEYNEHQTNR